MHELSIYPVPVYSGSSVFLDIGVHKSGDGMYVIYDQRGFAVRQGVVQVSMDGVCRLSVHGLASAVYFVTLEVDGVGYVGKVLVVE